jgi:5-formyltetrahydrofolate cyclo-ligase
VDEDIPMTEHDIPLTAILTPDELIEIKAGLKRPKGIYWNMLPEEKIGAIPVLKKRKAE